MGKADKWRLSDKQARDRMQYARSQRRHGQISSEDKRVIKDLGDMEEQELLPLPPLMQHEKHTRGTITYWRRVGEEDADILSIWKNFNSSNRRCLYQAKPYLKLFLANRYYMRRKV